MYYVAVYGSKVLMSESKKSAMVVYRNFTAPEPTGRLENDVSFANYLAYMSVFVKAGIFGGTPISVVGDKEGVICRGTVEMAGPPVFDAPAGQLIADRATQARKDGRPLSSIATSSKAETFAAQYGWLCGADNHAHDAIASEKAMLRKVTAA